MWGLSGYRSAHHRMLHEDEVDNKTAHNDSIIRSEITNLSAGGTAEEGEQSERTHMTTTTMKLHCSF